MGYCRECGVVLETDNHNVCLSCSLDLAEEERESLERLDGEYSEDDDDNILPEIDLEDFLG